jgi:hypothetical protein
MRKVWMFPMVLVLASAAHAQTYRWVDKDGTVHMGNQPPAGVEAALVKGKQSAPPRSGPGQASGNAEKSPMTPEVDSRRQAETSASEVSAQEPQKPAVLPR